MGSGGSPVILPPGRKEYCDVCSKRENPFPSGRTPESGNKSPAFRTWLDGGGSAAGCAAGDEPDAWTRERRGFPVVRAEPSAPRAGTTPYAGAVSDADAAAYAGGPTSPLATFNDEPGRADGQPVRAVRAIDPEPVCAAVGCSQHRVAEPGLQPAQSGRSQPKPVGEPQPAQPVDQPLESIHRSRRIDEVVSFEPVAERLRAERCRATVDGRPDGDPATRDSGPIEPVGRRCVVPGEHAQKRKSNAQREFQTVRRGRDAPDIAGASVFLKDRIV
jgi:hypothetical protein